MVVCTARMSMGIHPRENPMIFDGVGVIQDQYEQVSNEVTNTGTEPAPGMLIHHAGPTGGGSWVIETGESPEALPQTFAERLGAAVAAAGIQVQPKTCAIINSV